MNKKKLMILGASPFFIDAYEYCQQNNIFTIAIDIKPKEVAICKKMANKSFEVSTRDLDTLIDIALTEKVDGIYVGASETNMQTALELKEKLGLKLYCSPKQWEIGTNKRLFKEMCERNEIPVTPYFSINNKNYKELADGLEYPVVTKPVDNNGSTGISICSNVKEFIDGFEKALESSLEKDILVEEYMDGNSVIIHYTMIKGKAYFSGMSDKMSSKINNDSAPVMAKQCFPSNLQMHYLNNLNEKVSKMFEEEGFLEGPIWIETFVKNNQFYFNEMGYRYGGSMTYKPVEYVTGLNQVELMINHALGLDYDADGYRFDTNADNENYFILPIHIKPGQIKKIEGLNMMSDISGFHYLTMCHVIGDTIEATGNVHQVFCYLHLVLGKESNVFDKVYEILSVLRVTSEEGNEMLFTVFDKE